MKLSPHEIAYVASTHWSGEDLITATAIALAESDGDTEAMHRSTTGDNLGQRDHGLWQISGRWHGAKLVASPNWRDPVVNARLAKAVFDERVRIKGAGQGWTAWAVYNSGAHKTYLPDAKFAVDDMFPPPGADAPSTLTMVAFEEAAAAGVRKVLGRLDTTA